MNKPKILSFGNAYVDINATDFPFGNEGILPDTEIVGSSYETVLGGSAVTFANLCNALGLDAMFVGKRGDDAFGRLMEQLFRESGITPLLLPSPNVQTNVSFNISNHDHKSIMLVAGTANQSLSSKDIVATASEQIADCNYIYIGGCFKQPQLMDGYAQIAELAKANECKIILDHSRLNSSKSDTHMLEVKQLVGVVDYYLPSRDEFLQLWRVPTIQDGLADMSQYTDAVVVVKDGSNGAWLSQDGKPVLVPAFGVKPLHTIGAGDSFNAGFITAQSGGMGIRDSVIFASATAALKISKPDLPNTDEVDEFIASNS